MGWERPVERGVDRRSYLPDLIDRADGDSSAAKIIHPAGVHKVPVVDGRAVVVDGAAVEVGHRAGDHQSTAGLVFQLPSQALVGAEVEYLYGPCVLYGPRLSSRLTNMLIRPELMILPPVRFAKTPSPS